MKKVSIPVLVLSAALLAGCPDKAVYQQETFATDSPFKLKVEDQVASACESARRSLLGQGYQIETVGNEQVKGRKSYRSSGNLSTFIEMNIVCVPDRVGSTLFANGVLSTYDLKQSSSAASVGLSAVGSISLPIGRSADSMVKIAEETIDDKEFYGRFFAAVDFVLGEMAAGKPADVPAVAVAAPVPAQAAPAVVEPPAAAQAAPIAETTQPASTTPPGLAAPPVETPATGAAASTAAGQPPATTPAIAEELGPAQVPQAESAPAPASESTTEAATPATIAVPVRVEPQAEPAPRAMLAVPVRVEATGQAVPQGTAPAPAETPAPAPVDSAEPESVPQSQEQPAL